MDNLSGKILLQKIRAYFLVWSWAVILGVYVSSSTLFVNQMFSLQREGFRGIEFGILGYAAIALLTYTSMLILALGWIVFLRYSNEIYRAAVSDEQLPTEQLLHLFSGSLRYLVFAWLLSLLAGALPAFSLLSQLV